MEPREARVGFAWSINRCPSGREKCFPFGSWRPPGTDFAKAVIEHVAGGIDAMPLRTELHASHETSDDLVAAFRAVIQAQEDQAV
jgi:hypothetical protein